MGNIKTKCRRAASKDTYIFVCQDEPEIKYSVPCFNIQIICLIKLNLSQCRSIVKDDNATFKFKTSSQNIAYAQFQCCWLAMSVSHTVWSVHLLAAADV